jgi:hypothetical protein
MGTESVNPFAPPAGGAEVADRPAGEVGWWWRAYCWLSLLGLGYAVVANLSQPKTLELIQLPVYAVGVLGLTGYAYRRRRFGRGFWVVWFPLQLCVDLVAIALSMWGWTDGGNRSIPARTVPLWALGFAFTVPLYIALFRYAYRSGALWSPPVSSPPAGPA